MFEKGEIWAYPTDTSFGLGVRADDPETLEKLRDLKARDATKFFSLMVRDWKMLKKFTEIPANLSESFFTGSPKTVILKPTQNLPISKFWPLEKVAFRICNIPGIYEQIIYPITATSANISGEPSIYSTKILEKKFGNKIKICEKIKALPKVPSSEIWDFTDKDLKRLR